jgi:hypothetical protein
MLALEPANRIINDLLTEKFLKSAAVSRFCCYLYSG